MVDGSNLVERMRVNFISLDILKVVVWADPGVKPLGDKSPGGETPTESVATLVTLVVPITNELPGGGVLTSDDKVQLSPAVTT